MVETGQEGELSPGQLTLFDAKPSATARGGLRAPLDRLAAAARPYWSSEEDPRPVEASPGARVAVFAGIVVYVFLYSYWTIRNHDGYGTGAFDLGLYDQGLWLLSRFKAPFVTIMGRNLFGDHTSFILLPLVPIYWVVPSAKVLLLAQSAALGLGALPAFLIGREKLRSEVVAAFVALAYLLHPAIGWTNFEQFHPDVFEVPLLLFAFWYMLKRRWTPFLICVVAVLLVKEDVAPVAFALGIYVALRHDRRIGAITMGMSALYMAMALWWILPTLNGVGSLNAWRIPFGGPGGVVRTALLRPGELLSYLVSDGRPWYLLQLSFPLGLLSIATPSIVLIASVPLVLNLLSNFWYQYHIEYHYSTLIVPLLVVAAIFTIAKARAMEARKVMATALLGCAISSAYVWGPTTFSRHPGQVLDPDYPSIANVDNAISMIPPSASVSSYYAYVPHVDHRERIYMFPTPFRAAYWGTFRHEGQRLPEADSVEYVLVPTVLDGDNKTVMDSIRNEFVPVYEAPNVSLFKRKPA